MSELKSKVPTVFVVLGATGDLMAKKIAPALFNLFEKKELPHNFVLMGVSRREWTDNDMRRHIEAILNVKAPHASRTSIEAFLGHVIYQKLTFDAPEDYLSLRDALRKIDDEKKMCSNKLFYLSVPPEFYHLIFENFRKAKLNEECGMAEGWTRVIVEKPFGKDEKSAKALDARLAALFREEQIYRVDHYLAKEMLQNILAFRFANNLFENEWDGRLIEAINIRGLEDVGVEDRGDFYDAVGTLRDVGQNHLLQMLALVTMERPARYDADAIRSARAELIETLQIPGMKEAVANSFRAQYHGYRSITHVRAGSDVETYFRLKGSFASGRFKGVPFIFEAGKRLREKITEIEVLFRHASPCLCPPGRHFQNKLLVQAMPKEIILLTFYSKKPGHAFELEERTLHFDFRKESGTSRGQYTEEYEKLLLDCVRGDQTLFVSSREIEAMWRFVDPFLVAWEKNLVPLHHYTPDTKGILAEAEVALRGKKEAALPKEIGVFGLGKMGANVARQLKDKGWKVVVANRSPDPVQALGEEGFETVFSHEDLIKRLPHPRVIWVMITAGKGIDEFLFGKDGIVPHLKKGDIVVDSGNSLFEDTVRRAKILKKKGIRFMDVGFSGGPGGARRGGSLMIGGDLKTFEYLEPLFRDLSVPEGYAFFGDAGAGHFVKMVHNGIEYGMMQSLAEGFALMKKSPFKLDLEKIANIYNRGSVIESKLVGWLSDAFRIYGKDLKKVSGSVAYTGEGEWTVKTAKKWRMKVPAIEDAFKFRVRSQKSPSYMGQILSALRNRFGGHSIEKGKKS